jgi:NAD(P)H-nitrite reductase large subunit
MTYFKYLIIGGGMSADSAVTGIREHDSKGAIAMISSEPDPPYDRPPLTKGLWKNKPLDSIWRKTAQQNVDLHLGRNVEIIDPATRSVTDIGENTYGYDKLLIATGGTPKQLPFGKDHILYFRTVSDYRKLRELCERGQHFAVVGGGFIGSELAAALTMNKKAVTMVFPGLGICQHMFPPDLCQFCDSILPRQRRSGAER